MNGLDDTRVVEVLEALYALERSDDIAVALSLTNPSVLSTDSWLDPKPCACAAPNPAACVVVKA